VEVQPFAGTLESARAFGPGGRRIPLSVRNGRLTPQARLNPGEQVSVEVVVRRPRWLRWALGGERRERRTLRTPGAHVRERWLTVATGSAVRVTFDQPVSAVAYGTAGHLARRLLPGTPRSILLGRRAGAGSVQLSAAARSWERLDAQIAVSWFPPSRAPVLLSSPAPSARISPVEPIRLTFSRPVVDVLGAARPTLSPRVPGGWRQADSHTLVFAPRGLEPPLPYC
jgi:hypothetical protein